MKQFTLIQLCLFVLVAAAVVSVVVTIIRNRELTRKIVGLRDASKSFYAEKRLREDANAQQQLGASFLVDLALNPTGRNIPILRFLDTIDDEHLRFRKIELEADDTFAIYWFSESPFEHDFTSRNQYAVKSLCILVNLESGELIDSIMGSEGLYSYYYDDEFPENELQRIEWGREDGVTVNYLISRTGFHERASDEK